MNILIFVYLLIAWYLDHILPGNRGSTESPFFFLSGEYWRCIFGRKLKRKLSG